MAEKYWNWCDDVEIVHTDAEGKEYCLFHAPSGCKGEHTRDTFNARVFERIERAKADNQGCELHGTIFEWSISFSGYNMGNTLPVINFSDATFASNSLFINVMFSGIASFKSVTFSSNVLFMGAMFTGDALFEHATFIGVAGFSSVTFGQLAVFESRFDKFAYFAHAQFKDCIFRKCEFLEKADFSYAHIERSGDFVDMQMGSVSFKDFDIERVRFTKVDWPKEGGRNIVYDERAAMDDIRAGIPELLDRFMNALYPWEVTRAALEPVRGIYNRFKQKCKEEHNEAEASAWHFSEKEMRWKLTRFQNPLEFVFLLLYRYSSRYAESPKHGLVTLLLLIALYAFGFNFVDLTKDIPKLGYTDLLANSMIYATFQKSHYMLPSTAWGHLYKVLGQVLIPLQTALFALAVRNRFRR